MKTAYLTKYALTHGVEAVTVKTVRSYDTGSTYVSTEEKANSFSLGTQIFYDLESAKAKAEKMRLKKIISLENQIEKLKKLKF